MKVVELWELSLVWWIMLWVIIIFIMVLVNYMLGGVKIG